MVKKLIENIISFFEALIYVFCYIFIILLSMSILAFLVKITIEDNMVKMYMIGILLILLTMLSIVYISSYNKKYKKNDSNSSERPDYFIFEGNLPTKEGRK